MIENELQFDTMGGNVPSPNLTAITFLSEFVKSAQFLSS